MPFNYPAGHPSAMALTSICNGIRINSFVSDYPRRNPIRSISGSHIVFFKPTLHSSHHTTLSVDTQNKLSQSLRSVPFFSYQLHNHLQLFPNSLFDQLESLHQYILLEPLPHTLTTTTMDPDRYPSKRDPHGHRPKSGRELNDELVEGKLFLPSIPLHYIS
jgi:hypothetical protein